MKELNKQSIFKMYVMLDSDQLKHFKENMPMAGRIA
jgi:hypothetical protein